MKKVIILLLISVSVYCQDTILLKNGTNLKSKILEINPTEIKYKSFDNLDGPVITIYKKEAKSIVYQNGKIENFEMAVPTKPVLKSEGQKSEYDRIFYTNSGGTCTVRLI